MASDVLPWEILPDDRPKERLSAVLNRLGIWQGQWSMFAPNPSVNNYWLTAELQTPDGEKVEWSSPYWPEASTWEKFHGFRSLNYYNRLQLPQYRFAAEDLAAYLRRQMTAEHDGALPVDDSNGAAQHHLRLFANGLRMVYPTDSSLPPPEEITWVTYSEVIAHSE